MAVSLAFRGMRLEALLKTSLFLKINIVSGFSFFHTFPSSSKILNILNKRKSIIIK